MPNEAPKRRRSPTRRDDPTNARATIAAEICKAIATGESIRNLLGKDRPAHWPERSVFWEWQFADPSLRANFETALRVRGIVHAEQVDDIVSETPPQRETKFGSEVDSGYVAWQKLRAETRQWMAERMAPKLYGAKVGANGESQPTTAPDAGHAKRILLGRLGALVDERREVAPRGEVE